MQNNIKILRTNQHKWQSILINGYIRQIQKNHCDKYQIEPSYKITICNLIKLYFMIFVESITSNYSLYKKFLINNFTYEELIKMEEQKMKYYRQIAFGNVAINLNSLNKYEIDVISYDLCILKKPQKQFEQQRYGKLSIKEGEEFDEKYGELSIKMGFINELNGTYIGYHLTKLHHEDIIQLSIYCSNMMITCLINEYQQQDKQIDLRNSQSWKLMITTSPKTMIKFKKFTTIRSKYI